MPSTDNIPLQRLVSRPADVGHTMYWYGTMHPYSWSSHQVVHRLAVPIEYGAWLALGRGQRRRMMRDALLICHQAHRHVIYPLLYPGDNFELCTRCFPSGFPPPPRTSVEARDAGLYVTDAYQPTMLSV